MSKIQEQIKALQLKQKKIEYISYLADLIKNDTKCIDFKDVQKEIVEKIEPFLLSLMTEIEEGAVPKESQSETTLTPEQVEALKKVADRVLTKPVVENQPFAQPQPQQPVQSKAEPPHQDKMRFALDNRHLADKRVQVINDKNVQIYGKVVGLDAPYVVIQTETGPVINVPLEKIVPV